jgi:hypothetical protein
MGLACKIHLESVDVVLLRNVAPNLVDESPLGKLSEPFSRIQGPSSLDAILCVYFT